MSIAPGLVFLLVTLAAGCTTLGNDGAPLRVPASRAWVFLTHPRSVEVAAMIERLEPRVCSLLGTHFDHDFAVVVRLLYQNRGETDRLTRTVSIDPSAFDSRLDETVAHELVHVHAVGRWANLPGVVEEGLAYWVAALATGRASSYGGPEPSAGELLEVLTAEYGDYLAAPDDVRARMNQAASWIASRLLPAPATSLAAVQGLGTRL